MNIETLFTNPSSLLKEEVIEIVSSMSMISNVMDDYYFPNGETSDERIGELTKKLLKYMADDSMTPQDRNNDFYYDIINPVWNDMIKELGLNPYDDDDMDDESVYDLIDELSGEYNRITGDY